MKRVLRSVPLLFGLTAFLGLSAAAIAQGKPGAVKPPWEVLLTTLKASASQYAKAPNEIKKSAVFNEARAFDAKLFADLGNTLTDWQGTLDELATTKGGKEVRLRVKIPAKKSGGFTISFSEGFGLMDDGISSASPVYAQVAEFAKGSCVLFSGTVSGKEDSASEQGAMGAPEYKIKFSAVKPCGK